MINEIAKFAKTRGHKNTYEFWKNTPSVRVNTICSVSRKLDSYI